MKKFDLHLVSDSTGDTLRKIARSVLVQFEQIYAREHAWPMIRTVSQIDKVTKAIEKNPGVVMYTIVDKEIRTKLKACCRALAIPCVPVLSRAITDISNYLKIEANPVTGKQHDMDEDYFARIEAMNFTIRHDDGQASKDLNNADIILVGASRTSKSPCCMYLAYRGYKTANVPFVLNCPLPDNLTKLTKPLIVGLTISEQRLMEIRKSRLISISNEDNLLYADEEMIKEELRQARKLFLKNNWPIIDVSKKSVEEVVATVIYYHNSRKNSVT
jgi:regulator of PEP synthase PpsR (kinase-PPPase family)